MATPERQDHDADERPVVTRYTDFRAYITDMIAYLKATQKSFSYRWFARVAGYASPSFLKLVAEGKRNLSEESIERFAKGLGLSRQERDVFEALVHMGQATSDTVKNRHYHRVRKLAAKDPLAQLESDQFQAYSHWYTFVVRELLNTPGFKANLDWISRRLRPRVRTDLIRRAIELLERLKLVVRDEDGRLQAAERILTTGPIVRNLAVRNFHRQMLELAIRSLDGTPRDQRNITGLTVAMTPSRYRRVCDLITTLRREILDLCESPPEEGEPIDIYQVSFALFPVTQEVKR